MENCLHEYIFRTVLHLWGYGTSGDMAPLGLETVLAWHPKGMEESPEGMHKFSIWVRSLLDFSRR